MRVIYWFYDVTAAIVAALIVLVIGLPVIALELIGLVSLEQSYTDVGVYDAETDAFKKES